MLTSSSSYSNNIKVMMAIDITVTKYNNKQLTIIETKLNFIYFVIVIIANECTFTY